VIDLRIQLQILISIGICMSEYLINTVTAKTLSEELPNKTFEQWMLWLQNNRNMARRAPYRIPYERMSGAVLYKSEEISKFIEWEKSRHIGKFKTTGRAAEVMRAFGIGEASGGANGRKLKCSINPQASQANNKAFIQMIIDDPLLVFKLDISQAEDLCKEMQEAIDICKGVTK